MSGNSRDYYYSSNTSRGSRSTRREDGDRDNGQDLPRLRDVLREHFDPAEPYHPAYNLQGMDRALPQQSSHVSQPGPRLPPIREASSRGRHEDSYEYNNHSGHHYERTSTSSRTQPSSQAAYHVLAPSNARGELVHVSSSTTKVPGIVREHVVTAGQSDDDPKKRFECHICGRRMERQSVYNQHMLTHTGERPHVCSHCPKTFNSKSNLNRHLLTHNPRGHDDEDPADADGDGGSSSSKKYYSSSRRA